MNQKRVGFGKSQIHPIDTALCHIYQEKILTSEYNVYADEQVFRRSKRL